MPISKTPKICLLFSYKALIWFTFLVSSSLITIGQDKFSPYDKGVDRQGFLNMGSATIDTETPLDRILMRDQLIDQKIQAIRNKLSTGKRLPASTNIPANGIFMDPYLTNVWGSVRPDLIKLESVFTMFALDYAQGLRPHLDEVLRYRGFRAKDFSKLDIFSDKNRNPTTIIENSVNSKLIKAGYDTLVAPTNQIMTTISDHEISDFLKLKETLQVYETNRWFANFLTDLSAHSRRVLLSVLYDDYAQSIFTSYLVEPSPSLIADFRIVSVMAYAAKKTLEQEQ